MDDHPTPADVTALAGAHPITPVKGSARRTDGRPADLLRPQDYPVTAVCQTCGREVWCKAYMFAEWLHIADDTTE